MTFLIDTLDKSGKFVIPGLMNANVHLCTNLRLDTLIRLGSRYSDIIVEGTQLALKTGQTTVFDTWGCYPQLRDLKSAMRAGVDILTHCDLMKEDRPTPPGIIQEMVKRGVYCSIQPTSKAFRTADAADPGRPWAMTVLEIATINVAKGYKVDKNLGTLEPGKYADMVVLNGNPLIAARN